MSCCLAYVECRNPAEALTCFRGNVPREARLFALRLSSMNCPENEYLGNPGIQHSDPLEVRVLLTEIL